MSHAKERKETNCLNCNAVVAGRFCQVCGQENVETHQSFGHLAGHFVSDIFHFDGQFVSTAKYLLFKPGFLTHEYMRGRRASYLDPIKMYFFVSAVFFLLFLSFFQDDSPIKVESPKALPASEIISILQNDTMKINKAINSYQGSREGKNELITKRNEQEKGIQEIKNDTSRKEEVFSRLLGPDFFGANKYHSREEYDNVQKKLPVTARDGWFMQKIMHRNIDIATKFRENGNAVGDELRETVFHHFPQTLFLSLPLFALLLRLLYIRKKNILYASHAIYTLHLYCALFVFMLLTLVLGEIQDISYMGWVQWVNYAVILYSIYYTFMALQVYYAQSLAKTLLKWVILNVSAFIVLIGLLVLEVMFAIYTI